MPTPTKGPRLGGSPAHERLILANLSRSLFEHGRVTTTEAKAKRLRPLAERMITFAKRGDLHARRRVLRVIQDKSVVHVLFAEIGPRYATRPGGYTRIVKLGPRKGDNAPMALIELVGPMEATASRSSQPARRARPSAAPATETAPAAAVTEVDEAAVASGDTVEAEGAPAVDVAQSATAADAALGDAVATGTTAADAPLADTAATDAVSSSAATGAVASNAADAADAAVADAAADEA